MRLCLLVLFLVFVLSSCSTTPPYNRSEWGGWRVKKCKSTREQVLIKYALPPINLDDKKCKVLAGTWVDFYTGKKITMADDPTIDHVVPVKRAHEWGGHKWDKKQKVKFYNDKSNLVVTSKSMNSEKGANDFVNWQPANRNLACRYAKRWAYVKNKYDLKFSKAECKNFKALEEKSPCPKPLGEVKGC